jgi:uncharacterized damage-inducible protein DinB
MELSRLFTYDDWANREEASHLGSIGAPPRAVRVFAHIVATEWLWISRLRSTAPRLGVWPELTLDQCAAELDGLRDAWTGYLHEAAFDTVIDYTNSTSQKWSNRVGDVLTHVIMHGAYHRGQIATIVRDAGEAPAYTDYIHCIRNEFISNLS